MLCGAKKRLLQHACIENSMRCAHAAGGTLRRASERAHANRAEGMRALSHDCRGMLRGLIRCCHCIVRAAIFQSLERLKLPKWVFRTVACMVLGGQVFARIFRGAWVRACTRAQTHLARADIAPPGAVGGCSSRLLLSPPPAPHRALHMLLCSRCVCVVRPHQCSITRPRARRSRCL